ncbi:MAG TPA: P-type conjugative transfer protein TrbL [Candidatus Competibacteraceae bacterium]|nr:P-type conjugative transfer protein TrbL [Candidatus Competibacteraceae bacterium]
MRRSLWLSVIPMLLCLSFPVDAQTLTHLANQYQAASAGWMMAALVYARRLFFLLAAIEIAVTSIYLLFQNNGAAEFFSSLLIKVLGLLFAYTLLVEAPDWIPTIIHSFTQAGSAIGHVNTLDPSAVVDQGIAIASAALQGINDASLFNAFLLIVVAGLTALTIVLSYAVVAAQLLMTLVESYLIIGGGVLMLGFAGSRWTTVFTERYLGYVVSVGIKLFVLFLLIGLGTSLAPQFQQLLADAMSHGGPQPSLYFDLVAGALTFMILAWQVPSVAASMMTGSPSLTLGTAATTTAMLTTAVANGVAKGMQQATASTRQLTDAGAGAGKLLQAAKTGIGEARQSGAGLTTAVRKTAGDIRLAASQQFKDSVIRGTGRESAAAAEKAAGDQAVQGWGRGTPLGNLTNRVHANRKGVPVAPTLDGTAHPPGARPSIHRVTPPPIPHDQAHGNITIRFKQLE